MENEKASDAPKSEAEKFDGAKEARDPDAEKSGADPKSTPAPAKFVRRADWGAKPPKWIESLKTPINKVVLTWTETDSCVTEEECKKMVKQLQEEHMKDEDCPDIRHNFLVGGDGVLYEGRGYTRMGPKYPKNNRTHEELYGKSIEIAFIQKHDQPLESVLKVAHFGLQIATQSGYVLDKFVYFYVHDGRIIAMNEGEARRVNDPPPAPTR